MLEFRERVMTFSSSEEPQGSGTSSGVSQFMISRTKRSIAMETQQEPGISRSFTWFGILAEKGRMTEQERGSGTESKRERERQSRGDKLHG